MIRLLNKKFIVLSLIALGVYFIYRNFHQAPQRGHHAMGMQTPEVAIAEVIQRNTQEWNEFSGKCVAVDEVDLHPQVSGIIESIHFRDGSFVKKGDLLFTIDKKPFAAEVARLEGALASAQAQVNFSRTEFERVEQLVKDKVISQSEYDTRKNVFYVSEANLKSAIAALDAAKISLNYTQIRSPLTGKISRSHVSEGDLVEPGMHMVLTKVISLSPIYVDFEVDEKTYLQYTHNMMHPSGAPIPVMMGLSQDEGTPYQGFIASFDNHIDNATGTLKVRAQFENPTGLLLPGLFARIKLSNAGNKPLVLITDRAIGTDQNKKFVFVLGKDNAIAYREIQLGPIVDNLRVVRSGLNPGEKIVVNGLQRVRPGMKIKTEMLSMDKV